MLPKLLHGEETNLKRMGWKHPKICLARFQTIKHNHRSRVDLGKPDSTTGATTKATGGDGLLEIQPLDSAAEPLSADELEERWAQQYVKEEFKRLGFSKVEGPFSRGPDYRVFQRGRWAFAEVETPWKNYLRHGHHLNSVFDSVEYLILLSADARTSKRKIFRRRFFISIANIFLLGPK